MARSCCAARKSRTYTARKTVAAGSSVRLGAFVRTIPMPEEADPDRALAKFDKGVLTLTVPKQERREPLAGQSRLASAGGIGYRLLGCWLSVRPWPEKRSRRTGVWRVGR